MPMAWRSEIGALGFPTSMDKQAAQHALLAAELGIANRLTRSRKVQYVTYSQVDKDWPGLWHRLDVSHGCEVNLVAEVTSCMSAIQIGIPHIWSPSWEATHAPMQSSQLFIRLRPLITLGLRIQPSTRFTPVQRRLFHQTSSKMSAEDIITAYGVAAPDKQTQSLPGLDKEMSPHLEYTKLEFWDDEGKPSLVEYAGSGK